MRLGMRRGHQLTAVAILAAATAFAGTALGVEHVPHFVQGLELASGQQVRPIRLTTTTVPASAQGAWRTFRSDFAGSWLAMWDESTGVPLRIWGAGIDAPGSVDQPKTAETISLQMLQRHLALLAPGADLSNFRLVSNELHRGQRVVAFVQQANGLDVIGGQVSFRYRNDRLYVIASEAMPHAVGRKAATVGDALAQAKAKQWLETDFGKGAVVEAVEGASVLPMIGKSGMLGYETVRKVVVRTTTPIGKFDVFVDSVTGEPVAREQTLMFASGTIHYDVPIRRPTAQRADYPARYAEHTIAGQAAGADQGGMLSFADPGPATVTTSLTSQFAVVQNQGSGGVASTEITLSDQQTAIWSEPDDQFIDSQLTGFIHTQLIKDFAREIAPEMSWIDSQLPVRVNINDQCNAFYDGQSINFFRQSNNCENTGRLADVVYHEFGHGFHHRAVILGSGDFEGALSEGSSDYLAATFTNDPGMGRGFFYSNAPLRHIDPNVDRVWPDDLVGEVHQDGLIIAGALWDLRTELMAKHGDAVGQSVADNLFYQALKNASDIPTMYPEVLAADDDDGNLENGTPNVCEIIDAFGRHGLRTLNVLASSLSVEPPQQDGHHVSIELEGLFAQCPSDSVDSAQIIWNAESAPQSESTVAMTGGPALFEGDIPQQLDGEVVRYRVTLAVATGLTLSFPVNEADPKYQFFVGDVEPIYCHNFDTDPFSEGWSHGLDSGSPDEGADDWQWDTPNGRGGDPAAAYSGDYVIGNDLGHDNYNGQYQGDKVNWASSPAIDTNGFEYDSIRLQYRRWLNVEDGFYDNANIYANGALAWSNRASSQQDGANVHHEDAEWRFHDVDITDHIGDDGLVTLRWEIISDQGLHLGGWTMDDVCVVAYRQGEAPAGVCGDGTVDAGEECDDGNNTGGDGCSANCTTEDGNTIDPTETEPTEETGELKIIENGCGCRTVGDDDSDTNAPLAALLLGLGAAVIRRRKD